MISLAEQPRIDKDALIGACVRLSLRCDPEQLRADVSNIPAGSWGTRGGRVGVHTPTEGIFLRGFAPAEGEKPIEDRETLAYTPYIRQLINQHIPATPMRCLLAKLKPGAVIAPHVDRGDYFSKTLRLHFPIETDNSVVMISRDLVFRMQPGEIWALNNSNTHAVVSDWDRPRLHLICDFLPTRELIELILAGERNLGISSTQFAHRLATAGTAYQTP